MRRIVTLDSAQQGHDLSMVLLARGIDTEVREDDGEVTVWVRDDAQLDDARVVADAVAADPSSAGVRRDIAEGARRAKIRAADDARWRARMARVRVSVHGVQADPRLTQATMVLCVLVAVWTNLGRDPRTVSALVLTAYPPISGLPELWRGEVWRLFTPSLVHFGPLHLGFNLWVAWSFSTMVETRKGWRLLLPLMLATSAGAFLTEWAFARLVAPMAPAAGGLSGVLYGLFGYLFVKGRIDPADRLDVSSQTAVMLGLLLLLGFIPGSGFASGAHVGGLVVGGLWAVGDLALYRLRRRLDGP